MDYSWFEPSLEEMRADRALEVCAEFQIIAWEDACGGPYKDAGMRLANKVALIPQAREMRDRLARLSERDRRALARFLDPRRISITSTERGPQ